MEKARELERDPRAAFVMGAGDLKCSRGGSDGVGC